MNVTAIAVVTANGHLVQRDRFRKYNGLFPTSLFETSTFNLLSRSSGVVVVGRRTFETELRGIALPDRLTVVLTNGKKLSDLPKQLHFTSGSPQEVIESLEHKGFSSCLIAGGSEVFTQFLSSRMINQLLVTVVPLLSSRGIRFIDDIPNDFRLNLKEVNHDPSGVVHYHYSISY